MQKIRVSPKLTLVFGLMWAQHDELEHSNLHQQIGVWRDEGYRYAAVYSHEAGRVFGLYKSAAGQKPFDKTCISGAAVIATHRELLGKTGVVLIQFEEAEASKTSVIFVGLRNGVVVMDFVAEISELTELRNSFNRNYLPPGQAAETWGVLASGEQLNHVFTLAQLTPSKVGGKSCPVQELQSSRILLIAAIGSGLAVLTAVVYLVLQFNDQAASEAKRRLTNSENTPQVLYAKELQRWMARPINLAAPSLEAMRTALLKFPVLHAGSVLESVSCFGEQCSASWKVVDGTLEEFRAAAPASWQSISATAQNTIVVVLDFKLPTAKIDRESWPKFPALRDKLISHWQALHSTGWRIAMGTVRQLAVPKTFSPEQARLVSNTPGAPYGVDFEVTAMPWWFADPDSNAPLSVKHFSEQVELTDPIVMKYDRKEILFSMKGTIYVSN